MTSSSPDDPAERPADEMARLYDELRGIAARYMARERAGHTLQPTALVNEAYIRLAGLDRVHWHDRAEFLAAAAGTIRRVLIDHARRRLADKRGGGWERLTLSGLPGEETPGVDVLALEDALERLGGLDESVSRVVELRFYGGLTIPETARVMGVGITSIKEKWEFARAWLRHEMRDDG